MKRIKIIVYIIIIFNIFLSYELTIFSEMTFPLRMTSDGSTVVGSNMYNQAVIWENGIITYLGNIPGGNSCDAFYSIGLGMSSDRWNNCFWYGMGILQC